jgi:hypothetical protein
MPSGKARYNARPTFAEVVANGEPAVLKDFSESLRSWLIEFHKKAKSDDQMASASVDWPMLAERFADEVMAEARFAFGEIEHRRFASKKSDIVAERKNLAKRLKATINLISKYPNRAKTEGFGDLPHCLRHISRDLDGALGINADPRECADLLDEFQSGSATIDAVVTSLKGLVYHVEVASKAIREVQAKPREQDLQRELAAWLAESVIPVLKQYGLSVSCYASSDHGRSSDGVKILKAIGDEVGLCFTEGTWREVISQVR